MLGDLRAGADVVIDTSALTVHDLRRRIEAAFGAADLVALHATVMSFGFKYGIPVDADLVADMRFLPNPHWDPALRPLTGLDAPVSAAVLANASAVAFLDAYAGLVQLTSAGYVEEGKRYLTIAIGCTGGQHRSVAIAESTGDYLKSNGYRVSVAHRDLKLAPRAAQE